MMNNNEGASFFVRVVFCVVDRVRDTLSSLFEFGRIVVELEAFLTAPSSLFRVFFGPFTSFFSKKSSSLVAREKISDIDGTTTRPMCSCRSIDLVEALYKWRRCDATTTTTTTGRRRRREFFPFLSLSPICDIFRRGEEEEVSFPHKKIMIKMM